MMRLKMWPLYILSALAISVISTKAVPLANCPTKGSNISMFDLFEPFGVWHAVAIASAETHDGLNSITIYMNDAKTLYLYIDWNGICTKIEKIYSNSSKNASKEKWDYVTINQNDDYVILHHYDPGKCVTHTFFLFGKNPTASVDVMEQFKTMVECSEIPGLTIYTLPQENGNCTLSIPEK